MKLEEMTMGDLYKHELFRENLGKIINAILAKLDQTPNHKTTPYDKLRQKGVMNVDSMVRMYSLVEKKILKDATGSERNAIKEIGDKAFYLTVTQLKQKEEVETKK